MHTAIVHPSGAKIRWVELPGTGPARVYVHGLGACAAPYFAAAVAHLTAAPIGGVAQGA
ncbi:hypothetical protein [Streptosporangium lutulentum]|uniref:Alpha/beta hydrolase n=1 Tax=Streptosporangium lutulentum TaxID=1461250 RepID=A0ABT9QUS3_9ACTN|nr:hypothetical protein [Streptosporangium lutulentum]MDP9850038.1 hypothetical protein [Streptosporangium lutulentum]